MEPVINGKLIEETLTTNPRKLNETHTFRTAGGFVLEAMGEVQIRVTLCVHIEVYNVLVIQ